MRAAVTGVGGFVGSHLAESLLAQGHQVLGLDRKGVSLPQDLANHADFSHFEGDIRDERSLPVSELAECEVIFHMAAVVGVARYLANPYDVIDVNVFGTRSILRSAETAGSRVVVASTSEIYGKNPKVPWAEDDDRVLGGTQIDRWSYSTSKAAAEHLALATHKSLGLPVSIVRYFNAYGPRQAPIYVISKTIHRVLNGKRPLLYDDGRQTRCFTYINDVVDGTIAAGTETAAIGEVFNLGSTVECSIAEVIDLVIERSGSHVEPQPFATEQEFGTSYQDIVRRVPDTSKAASLLGWKAVTSLASGVDLTLRWARAQPSWLEASDT